MTTHRESTDRAEDAIAIVGMSCLFPGSADVEGFWRDILAGRDRLSDVPPSHWLIEDYYDPDPSAPDRTYGKRGGFIPKVDFDPVEFGVPPSTLPATDTAQLLALIVAQRVLSDATSGHLRDFDRARTSVILGVASATELVCHMASRLQRPVWLKSLREAGIAEPEAQAICDRIASHYQPWQESSFPGLLGNVVAGRIANRLDLGGTNCVVDAACASSLAAVSMAARELWHGDSDLVIAGGVDALNDILMYMCFSKTPALSATGDCRPFSTKADGTMLGEGLGMVALRRLADAERDGNPIYAVLRGIGASSDGRAKSVYAPRPEGQASALRRAYHRAGFTPGTVELIEAHGTGTVAGDAAELAGLGLVFKESGSGHCALGSVKSQIGHTKAAAGIAGLIKAVLALHAKILPPTAKVDAPSPAVVTPGSPFYLSTQARPWIRGSDHPRRAGVSSFGFGGSNFHAALEEYSGPGRLARRFRTSPCELVLVAGRSADELCRRIDQLRGELDAPSDLQRQARATQLALREMPPLRLAVVASDTADLIAKLERARADIHGAPQRPISAAEGIYYRPAPLAGEVALLFPGQGSQYLGMGGDLAMAFDSARRVWDRTRELTLATDARLDEVVFPTPAWSEAERVRQAQRLTDTRWAQAGIAAVSAAQLGLLRALALSFAAVAGHSFGEVTALHAAGAIDEATLLRVARRRGELMAQAADRPGAMLAVAAAPSEVTAVLPELSEPQQLVIANYNAPRQLVLSGEAAAVAAAEARLGAARIATRRLPVSTAFHSPLVAAASAALRDALDATSFSACALPLIGGSTATEYPAEPAAMRAQLAAQLAAPVRFADQVAALYERGCRIFIEVGPGAVLTGLVGQCLEVSEHLAVALDQSGPRGRHGLESLWHALGQLAVAGVGMTLEPLWSEYREPLPRPPAQTARRTVQVGGANLGRLYPPPDGARALPPPNPAAPVAPVAPPAAASPRPEPPPPPAVPQAPRESDPGWMQALLEVQRQTAEVHTAYQRALTEGHLAFLRTAEVLAGGAPPPAEPLLSPPIPPAFQIQPAAQAMPPPPAAALPPVAAPARTAAPPPPPAVAAAPAPVTAVDPGKLLLEVVADKTGYPIEALNLDMEMEAGLGIDSIKRVEIFSALLQRAPGLPEVTSQRMASLRTLRDVVTHLSSAAPRREEGPARPFEQAPVAAATPAVERRRVCAALRPAPGFAVPGLLGCRRLVVVGGDEPLAAALLKGLAARGLSAERAATVPEDADGVLLLYGLQPCTGPEAAKALHRQTLASARSAASRLGTHGGLLVSVQDTGGCFGLEGHDGGARAWLGGLPGLCKTAAQEWPRATVRAIDIEAGGRLPSELAAAIAQELLVGGDAPEVGLTAGGLRYVPETVAAPVAAPRWSLPAASVVIATGGARGVTAAALLALCRVSPLRLALLGRTALADEPAECRGIDDAPGLRRALLQSARVAGREPGPQELKQAAEAVSYAREVRRTLAEIASTGSTARYVCVDIRDAAAVSQALAAVRREWGPIAGLIHGAGVLADKRIADKTDEQFDAVFSTKVDGLAALLRATAADPLRLICLFSSVAGRFGNVGQADYAMANEVLNKVAQAEARQRGESCLVRSIAWGPWQGGMVTPALRAHFEGRGVPLLGLEAGARAFVAELGAGPGGVEVVLAAAAPQPVAATCPTAVERELVVDAVGYPFLTDHRIREQPVLPVVLALEWFARAARATGLDGPLRMDSVRVLRGVQLSRFSTGGERLKVQCRRTAAALSCQLLDAEGGLRYAAELASASLPLGPSPPRSNSAGGWPWPLEAVYGPQASAHLFHGPAFRVLRSLDWRTAAGGAATLVGTAVIGWGGGPWHLDAAALDGALQLAILWGHAVAGRPSLPTGIGQVAVARPARPDESLRCTVRQGSHGPHSFTCDLWLESGEELLAVLRDVEMHFLPQES